MYKTCCVFTESLQYNIPQEKQNFSSTLLESPARPENSVDRRQMDRRNAYRFYFYMYMGGFTGK